MISRKVLYGFEALFIILITIIATTVAIWTNYNSNSGSGYTPFNAMDAQNQYQIDAEARSGAPGGAVYFNSGAAAAGFTFQEWTAALWPNLYMVAPFPGVGNDGLEIGPGCSPIWTLSGLQPVIAGGVIDLYPEVFWGTYELYLVFVTGTGFNPAGAPWNVNIPIDIVIDGNTQWRGNLAGGGGAPPLVNVFGPILIDFHLNSGQAGQATWPGQTQRPAPNDDHTIEIVHTGGANSLVLDEMHLSPV